MHRLSFAVAYRDLAAAAARAAGMGLWGMEFHDPSDWRQGARW